MSRRGPAISNWGRVTVAKLGSIKARLEKEDALCSVERSWERKKGSLEKRIYRYLTAKGCSEVGAGCAGSERLYREGSMRRGGRFHIRGIPSY